MCGQYNSFENTVGKGGIARNLSFSHSLFYPLGETSAIFNRYEIVVCKLFYFGRAKNLSFGKGLRILVFASNVLQVVEYESDESCQRYNGISPFSKKFPDFCNPQKEGF